MNTALSAPPQHISMSPESTVSADWKQQLVERLDSYRAKRVGTAPARPLTTYKPATSRASKIAQTVASRYQAAPSYKDLLLAAERGVKPEQAALAFDAPPVEERIEMLDTYAVVEDPTPASILEEHSTGVATAAPAPAGTPVMPRFAARTMEMHLHQASPEPEPSLDEFLASSLVESRTLLPSKLIEFPRELVAAHRARPHLAEGAVHEQVPVVSELEPPQLRIFEVAPDEIAAGSVESRTDAAPGNSTSAETRSETQPVESPAGTRVQRSSASARSTATARATAPAIDHETKPATTRSFKGLEWASISLDRETTAARPRIEPSVAEFVPFLVDPASIDRRVMAFAVDFAAVSAGFLGFLAVFAACTPHLPKGLTAVALGGVVYVALWVLYQMLFFSLSGATAGMLYARIALCTFDDQNPTRDALRRRLAAWWLSCLPLGLGSLWCFLDEDNLSWHDRMTRMYQRTY